MPVLSMFFGIIIRMYREVGGRHNLPHIHAEFSGEEAVVALDGTVLEGSDSSQQDEATASLNGNTSRRARGKLDTFVQWRAVL